MSPRSRTEWSVGGRQLPASYAEFRQETVARNLEPAARVVFVVTLLYFAFDFFRRPGMPWLQIAPYLIQLAVPVWVVLLVRGRLRSRAEWIAFAADVVFTVTIAFQVFLPTSTVSAVALILAIKLLSTALFFPWHPGFQYVSGLFTVGLYVTLAHLSGRVDLWTAPPHQLIGTLVAALLGSGGAARADRVRRELFAFERNLALEADLASRLAYAGQRLVASIGRASLFEDLCEVAASILHADTAHLLVPEGGAEAFVVKASHGYSESQRETMGVLRFRPGAVRIDGLRERGVAQIRTEELGHPGWMRVARGFGIRVALGIALRRGEELLGILSVCRRTRAEPFTAAEERLGLALGQMATLAWENQELFEDLEETNRRKSEFVATVAHEFRNPLGAILGYAGMLAESDLGTEERAWVGRIERNARELLGIVNATLDLRRLERGQLPVEVREVRLPEILADVEASVLELAKGRAVRFELAISGDLPPVHTDPTKLEIVLRNLATNAVKYTEEGSVRLEVEPRDGGVEFRVVDTGPGIAPEDLRRIFDPFFRGRRGKGAGGVGLGLFIVQRLVALLGGEVSVRSVPGEGTTFRLWIPESLEPRSGLAGAEGSQG